MPPPPFSPGSRLNVSEWHVLPAFFLPHRPGAHRAALAVFLPLKAATVALGAVLTAALLVILAWLALALAIKAVKPSCKVVHTAGKKKPEPGNC